MVYDIQVNAGRSFVSRCPFRFANPFLSFSLSTVSVSLHTSHPALRLHALRRDLLRGPPS